MRSDLQRFVGTGAPIPIDGGEGHLWGWQVWCNRCGNTARVTANSNSPLPPEVIRKKLLQQKWGIGKRPDSDVCPECLAGDEQERRKDKARAVPAPAPAEIASVPVPPPRFDQACEWIITWLNNLGEGLSDQHRKAVGDRLNAVITVADNVGIDLGIGRIIPSAPVEQANDKSELMEWLETIGAAG
jgi:hypothetical protein